MKPNTYPTFNCLDDELCLEGDLFLEASAGTGKTFAIEHITARLILEKKIPLEKILIVTFTNASTRDVKRRIFQNLQSAAEKCGSKADLQYLKQIDKQGLSRIQRALFSIDSAQIYTIHAFCFSMLNQFALEVGYYTKQEDDEIHRIDETIHSLVLDCLRRSSLSDHEREILLAPYKKDLSHFLRHITPLITSLTPLEACTSYDKLIEQIHKEYKAISPCNLREEIERVGKDYKGLYTRAKELKEEIEKEILLWENWDKDPDTLMKILEGKATLFSLFTPTHLKKGKQAPSFGKLQPFIERLAPLIEEVNHPTKTLLRFAHLCRQKLQELEQERSLVHPDQILKTMYEALDNPGFVQCVSEKYQAVIVDEFQDTDAMQWSIFRKLFQNRCDFFAVVGDPKQSIYRFRGADLSMYASARGSMNRTGIYRLDTNYRAHPALVQQLNNLFSEEHAPGWLTLEPSSDHIVHHDVLAGKEPKRSDDTPLFFMCVSGERGSARSWPTEEIEKSQIFPIMIAQIKRLKKKKKVPYKEMAILVKDRYQNVRVQDLLKEHGIPYTSSCGAPIVETAAFAFIELLLMALKNPFDLRSVRTFLASPLLHLQMDILQQSSDSIEFQRLLTAIHSLKDAYLENGFSGIVQSLACLEIPLLWVQEGQLEDYSDFRQLTDLILEYEAKKGKDLAALIDHLFELKAKNSDEMFALKKRQMATGDEVQLMTTHASKGLEFSYVFALGIASETHTKASLMRTMHEGRQQISLADKEKSACKSALLEQDREKMRLFYVALTRAKSGVFIPFIEDQSSKEIPLGSASAVSLFLTRYRLPPTTWEKSYQEIPHLTLDSVKRQLKSLQVSFLKNENQAIEPQKNSPPNLTPPMPVELILAPYHTLSFSALAAKQKQKTPPHELAKTTPPEGIIPHGKQTGIIIHSLFEKLIETGLYRSLDLSDFVAQQLAPTHLSDYVSEITHLIETTFSTPLYPLSSPFTLRSLNASKMITELEFFYETTPGEWMKGFCDLVIEHKGVYYIIDWKTNLLCDYQEKALIKTMEENAYDLQAKIYKEALMPMIHERGGTYGGALYLFVRGINQTRGMIHVKD